MWFLDPSLPCDGLKYPSLSVPCRLLLSVGVRAHQSLALLWVLVGGGGGWCQSGGDAGPRPGRRHILP